MLGACIAIVRTYIMIIQMYVTPASVTGWKADARKTSCQHRGWSSAKAKQLSRGSSFFSLGFIMKYLEKDKFCSLYRGSPIGFFNPVIPTQDFEQSCNPEDYFWHPTSRTYFQSRIPPDFASKSRIPSVKWGKSCIPENLLGTLYTCSVAVNIFSRVILRFFY